MMAHNLRVHSESQIVPHNLWNRLSYLRLIYATFGILAIRVTPSPDQKAVKLANTVFCSFDQIREMFKC